MLLLKLQNVWQQKQKYTNGTVVCWKFLNIKQNSQNREEIIYILEKTFASHLADIEWYPKLLFNLIPFHKQSRFTLSCCSVILHKPRWTVFCSPKCSQPLWQPPMCCYPLYSNHNSQRVMLGTQQAKRWVISNQIVTPLSRLWVPGQSPRHLPQVPQLH